MTTAMRKALCVSTVFAFFLYPAYLPAEIILPANPLAVERYAAKELAYHVEKATGKRLAIAYEDEVPAASTERRFYVGATEAARRAGLLDVPFAMDEHHFKTIGRDFYFLGGDKDGRTMDNAWSATSHGTMYAVYDFLENEMGVRWLWPGPSGEVIPTMKEIPCVNADRRCRERLVNRYFRLLDRHAHGCIGWHELSNREKFDFEQRKFMLRHRNGVSRYITAGHAFVNWWDRYGKTHPEFFQERLDGKRGPYGNSPSDARNVTMCVSSPGLHKAIVSEWLLSGFKDPSKEHYSPFVGCLENDSPGMCLCERCRSWDVPDGRFEDSDFWSRRMKTITRRECWSQLARVMWGEAGGIAVCREPASVTDRYVKFYNAVLAEARKYDPNAQVTGFAYANYLEPPKKTRVADGVLIRYVPRMSFPYSRESSECFRKWWRGWRDMGAKEMAYRPNYMLAGANLPIDMGRAITADFAFAASNGMTVCEFDSQTGAWSAQAAMNYVTARMLRDPTIGYDRAMEEFYGAFGAAGNDIKAFCEHVESVGKDISPSEYQRICIGNPAKNGNPGGGNTTFMLIAPDLYSEEFFARGDAILSEASRKVADDPEANGRVRFLAEGFHDALLTYRVRVAQKNGAADAFSKWFSELIAYRKGVEGDFVCNYSYHSKNERNSAGWKHEWLSTDGPQPKLVEMVMRGELQEARASWWGYDREDSTRFLQAAIDSKVPRLVVDSKHGEWRVKGIRGVSGQEIFFRGGLRLSAIGGAATSKERPFLDFRGLRDVRVVAFNVQVDAPDESKRAMLSIAESKRIRIEGMRFNNCAEGGIDSQGAVNFTLREVTRAQGKQVWSVQ